MKLAKKLGYSPYCWTRAEGVSTKEAADAQVKKLVGDAKSVKLGYGTYKTFS